MSIAGDDARIRGMRGGGGSRASIVIKADREEKEGGFPCQRQQPNCQHSEAEEGSCREAACSGDGGRWRRQIGK